MGELKSCPFCGGQAVEQNYSSTDGYMGDWTRKIYCTYCGVEIRGDNAAKMWNTRIESEPRKDKQ